MNEEVPTITPTDSFEAQTENSPSDAVPMPDEDLSHELVITQARGISPVRFIMADSKEFKGHLKELEGQDREKYIDMQATRVQFDAKGKPTGLKPLPGMDAWLIVRSLVTKDHDKNLPIIYTMGGESNALKFLAQFGSVAQSEMAKRVRRLSNISEGMDEDSQKKSREKAKNG